jgi:hypothetical protein
VEIARKVTFFEESLNETLVFTITMLRWLRGREAEQALRVRGTIRRVES